MKKSYWTAAPFALWMVLFTIIPLGMVVWFTLTDGSGGFTFGNILAIGDHLGTLWYSICIGAVSTAICLVLAYPIAYSISRKTERMQQTMVLLIMLPMWMNFVLRTYAWMTLLEKNGYINQFLSLLGLGPFKMINTSGAVIVGIVYNYLPFMILPLYSVMVKIDKPTIEAAQDLGGGGWQVLRRVILPLSVPGIVSGITMVFVPAVSTFALSKFLGGKVTPQMIGDAIEGYFIGQAPDYNLGASLSLILMVMILLSMAIVGFVDKGDDDGGLMV